MKPIFLQANPQNNLNILNTKITSTQYIETLKQKSIIIKSNILKNIFDMIFSLIFLIIIAPPLFLLIFVLIKISSRGNVFFIQDRVGINGSIFKCYKFRTMKDVTSSSLLEFDKKTSRVTKIGFYLRRYNLDELPQFINVLLGDMSIVGPRPHAINYHLKYSTFINDIDNRHFIKPGITGLAQIHGYRGDKDDEDENRFWAQKRIRYDIVYIRKWTIFLDFKIVIYTILQVLKLSNKGT